MLRFFAWSFPERSGSMSSRGKLTAAAFGLVAWLAAGTNAADAPSTTATLILGNTSYWRCQLVDRQPVVRVGGEIQTLWLAGWSGVWTLKDKAKDAVPVVETPAPPANWTAPELDDSTWQHVAGPFFATQHGWAWCKEADEAGFFTYDVGTTPALAAICVRGRFEVTDPAAAGDLRLSLSYRGGVVVYLNGQEVARASIPDAEKAKGLEALAEDYPAEAFVTAEGKIIRTMWGDPAKYQTQVAMRIRRLNEVAIPAKLLRKGINILAIEAHRAPHNERAVGSSDHGGKGYILEWCPVGVTRIALTATGSGVRPNVARPDGLQVWNQETSVRPQASAYGDRCEPLQPLRIVAARNGAFSGQLLAGAPQPLRGVKAVASELRGPATLPADAIRIRYALPDDENELLFEILSPDAPAEVPLHKTAKAAILPVWYTVSVPADAKPGTYKGTLTIRAEGVAPIEAAVEVRVHDWALPDPKAFASHVGITESPESVALKYKVPLWSPEHWKRLDQVFALLGQAGADDVFITALRRTHHGNEHGMIRWVRPAGGGEPAPDFKLAEQYLDVAIRHLGKVPVVCLYCWEPCTGGSYGGKPWANKGVAYTILDAASGKLEEAVGPLWGTPEARTFWKPVLEGMTAMLQKRGMEQSLMVGVAGDSQPNKDAVEDLKAAAPNAKWVVQSHMTVMNLHGQPVGYLADVWNSPVPPDPAVKRLYGWQSPMIRTTFPREGSKTVMPLRTWALLAQYRIALEGMSAAGIRGFGRMGADYWNVLETPNKTYGHGRNLIARYPESDWGQLYLGNTTPYLLAAGPQGPLATVRFEMIREGAQDVEARIFLEQALLDSGKKAKLGEAFATRCQQLLDDRVRAINLGRQCWSNFAGAPERLEALYTLAAEAAAKLR
jgi:hypothetical protein